jgi:hypothetical protein
MVTLLGIGSLTATGQQSQANVPANKQQQTPLAATNASTQTDSDGDGLYDWEEQLLGTNPNTVTVGTPYATGTSRLRDIRSSVNLSSEIMKTRSKTKQLQSRTQELSRQKAKLPDAQFTPQDATVTQTSSSTISRYITTVLQSTLSRDLPSGERVLSIIKTSIETGSATSSNSKQRLKSIATTEQAAGEALMQARVPEALLPMHLDIANGLYLSGKVLKQYVETDDPTEEFLYSAQYMHFRDVRSQAILGLSDYYGSNMPAPNNTAAKDAAGN